MKALSPRGEQIVDAAIELLSIGGIPALTTKNLASAVGVTEPALYRHFKNKMDILEAILIQQEWMVRHRFERYAEQGGSVLDQIEEVYAGIFRGFADNPARSAVAFAEEIFRQDSHLAEHFNRIMEVAEENIIALLASEQGRKECRTDIPPKDLARMMMGSSRLLVTRWRLGNYNFDLEEQGARLWKSLRTALAPYPGPNA
ncbi:TetR/AcrR family transcriptional regulator [Pontiella sp.]|uniref:TetR/AcrR family transcriptional regulator n=1 Tax=Pontiella sp. TaxID=2837462 RepID=UPI0035697A91